MGEKQISLNGQYQNNYSGYAEGRENGMMNLETQDRGGRRRRTSAAKSMKEEII